MANDDAEALAAHPGTDDEGILTGSKAAVKVILVLVVVLALSTAAAVVVEAVELMTEFLTSQSAY